MTNQTELRVYESTDFAEIGMFFIATGGDAKPIKEIDNKYLGKYYDMEYMRYEKDHPDAKQDGGGGKHIYVSLARVSRQDRNVPLPCLPLRT